MLSVDLRYVKRSPEVEALIALAHSPPCAAETVNSGNDLEIIAQKRFGCGDKCRYLICELKSPKPLGRDLR